MKITFILLTLFGILTAAKLGLHANRRRNSQFADLSPKAMTLLRKLLNQHRCKLHGRRLC